MLDPVISEMMHDAGWNQTTQIYVLLDFIDDELGAVKDLKRYIAKRVEEEQTLGKDTDAPEGYVPE